MHSTRAPALPTSAPTLADTLPLATCRLTSPQQQNRERERQFSLRNGPAVLETSGRRGFDGLLRPATASCGCDEMQSRPGTRGSLLGTAQSRAALQSRG